MRASHCFTVRSLLAWREGGVCEGTSLRRNTKETAVFCCNSYYTPAALVCFSFGYGGECGVFSFFVEYTAIYIRSSTGRDDTRELPFL